MSSLIITKQTGNFFSLVLDGGSPIISEQNRLTTVGNFCNFKTANGANLILKQNILYSDITIVTGVSHVPTSINDLWISLLDAGFFDGLATTGGSSTIDKFTELLDTFSSYIGRDGQLLVVNESEQKIETIAISLFSEDDRTKLDGIETGAQVNVQSDVNETNPASPAYIKNFPDLGLGYTAEDVANKVSVITGYDVDLYPNEKATHDALDLKLNISDLPTNLTLYPTTVTSDVSSYVVMVKDIHDVRYNSTAVDVSTPTITGVGQLISQRISDAGVLIGQPGVFNITTFGNIRHLSGSGTATFYFEVYHRDLAGVETLICTSSTSEPVVDGGYSEFTASGLWNDGDFVATDRIVIKSYANRIAGGSDPIYQFQFGGTTPVRTLLPVPFSVVDAGYELKSNKSDTHTTDTEKYYSATYVNDVLPTSYSKIVYVNATSPTTATIFDLNNPPITNDNLLKNDTANLYIGTDASTWVYLTGTGYVTKTISSATSNFNTFGTTVDAGNSKTSHITRSGAVTLTGSLNLAVAKISTTPNTSAGSYDILTRNSSTTALEKKLISDFLQTTGNQSFTGIKTGVSTNATLTGFNLTNEVSNSALFLLELTNSATSSASGSGAIKAVNINSGVDTSGLQVLNQSTGLGGFLKNLSTGTGLFIENWSSGIANIFNSRTGSTGDLIRFAKNNILTTSINHLGEIITMSPTATNQVATKGYADGKITQTITNGVTDKSPSEDAVFDALASKANVADSENITNKQNSLAVDGTGTKYPTVDAVNGGVIKTTGEQTKDGLLKLGNGSFTSDDSALLINRNITTGGTALGFHALRDETLYNTNATSGLRAYASYDGIPKMQGTASFNHLHVFQSRPNFSGTSTIDALRGFTHQSTIASGTVDLHQAIFIDDYLGAGTVNQNVGIYLKPLLKGVANYAIFSEGVAPSFFGGTLQTNGLVQGATAKFTSYSGTFGSFPTFDSAGAIMNNPNLTIINGVLSMKFSTAKITSTAAALELNSLNNLLFSTAGVEKARIATNGNLLLGSSTDNGALDKLQVTGTLATTSTIKAGATVRLKNYTVATLPAGVQGDTAYVTDALAPTYLGALVGGGSVVCSVFFNGTAWVSH